MAVTLSGLNIDETITPTYICHIHVIFVVLAMLDMVTLEHTPSLPCPILFTSTVSLIIPWWAEPQRHTVVVVCPSFLIVSTRRLKSKC